MIYEWENAYIYFTIVWQFHSVFREEYSIKKTVLKNLNDYYSQIFLLRQKFFDFSVIANFEYPNHGKPSFLWRNDSLSDCRYKINCSTQYVIPLTLNTAHHNLYINDRAVLPTHLPHFMKKMLYCLPSPSFFKFCWWSHHIWCATLLNVMDLHMMWSLDTLVPEGPWCVIYATRHQVYWYLTCFFAGTLILHKYTHTHTHHTAHSWDWYTHITIYSQHLFCADSSYLYYIEWIIHWYQKSTFSNVLSFKKLFTYKSHISVD